MFSVFFLQDAFENEKRMIQFEKSSAKTKVFPNGINFMI